MADNFDSNIARRKPDTKRARPIHPWDISAVSPHTADDTEAEILTAEKLPEPEEPLSHLVDILPESKTEDVLSQSINTEVESDNLVKTFLQTNDIHPLPVAAHNIVQSSVHKRHIMNDKKQSNDLSDTININSNYFKLHNDVSDHLFRTISPSAQSVYLRLYRQSYGWNRNWAAESLPKLTVACNLSLQTVRKAIKELESIGCIKKQFNDFHKATVYRIYLPSEISIISSAIVNNTMSVNRGLNINIPSIDDNIEEVHDTLSSFSSMQKADSENIYHESVNNLYDDNAFSGGQEIDIHSVYFSGTSIYTMLRADGPLTKNIYKYMYNKNLGEAVLIIDEFYQSIGFSIVSRSLYRKSILDFFEILGSGFSADDVRYAVRWTFKNSKSRPESFSLIKHTMHLAMDEFIKGLKGVSEEKTVAEEKQKAIQRQKDWESRSTIEKFTVKDTVEWNAVLSDLRDNINIRSFTAFIEPLKLIEREGDKVVLSSPPDSVSWVNDHFVDIISESYFRVSGKEVRVEVI